MLLDIRDLHAAYGLSEVLFGLTLAVKESEVATLLGRNGMGKTTTVRAVAGLLRPVRGEVLFKGERIDALPAHRITHMGVGLVPEGRHIFPNLTVRDNLELGSYRRGKGGYISDALRLPSSRASERDLSERVQGLVDYLELNDVAERPVAGLPFGTQKRVELARALAAQPKLLLLDEPACGLNDEEVHELGNLIRQIRDERRITVLLVEHHMSLVMAISDRVVALNFGRKLAEGTPREIQANEDVVRAYLGDAA